MAKLDGRLQTWAYHSALWTSDDAALNTDSLEMDTTEARLEAFSRLPVSSLLLGMSALDGSNPHWMELALPRTFPSLQAAFASGADISTNAGRSPWLSLANITSDYLQPNCNAEGCNVRPPSICAALGVSGTLDGYCSVVRVGLLGNNEGDCLTPDSFIGFGGYTYWTAQSASPFYTCGVASHDAGISHPRYETPLFGYILGR